MSDIKERPILFKGDKGDMVRAILSGQKTQTRRVFKVTDPNGGRHQITSPSESIEIFDDGTFHYLSTAGMSGPYPCPYGKPGDRLWVFMPRWASRITLEITNVRVERLLDISVQDALAEGIQHNTMACPKAEYFQLWNSINGDMAHEQNPWVWVVEFNQLTGAEHE